MGTAPDDEIEITPDAGRLIVQHLRPVDNEPPDASMTAGPSGLTGDPTPEFAFTSSEQNSSFRAGSTPARRPSSSPAIPRSHDHDPRRRPHTFEVRARDRAGNLDPTPVGRVFTVDTTPPVAPVISDTDPDSPANDNKPEVGIGRGGIGREAL